MNKLMMVAGGILTGTLVGCSTVDPLQVEQTSRDLKTYEEKNVEPLPVARYKIAVVCKSSALSGDNTFISLVNDQMESAVANNFSGLGWFETVDRKNGVSLAQEAAISSDGDIGKIPGADYVLIADSKISYVAKQGWKRTSIAKKARGAQLETDFRLIELATKETIFVQKIRSTVTDCEKGAIKEAISIVANRNAKKLSRVIASRFLPGRKVVQTRGDGRYAQVNMGKNYQATPAVKNWQWWPYKYLPLCYLKLEDVPAAKVDFFTVGKTDEGGKAKYSKEVFARGRVISSERDKAWVEVDNYDAAGVFKGHGAKISEEISEGDDIELE